MDGKPLLFFSIPSQSYLTPLPHTHLTIHISHYISQVSFSSFRYCNLFVPPDLRKKNPLSLYITQLLLLSILYLFPSIIFFVSQDRFKVCCRCNLEAKLCVKITRKLAKVALSIIFTVSHFQVLQCPSVILSLFLFQLITLPFNSLFSRCPLTSYFSLLRSSSSPFSCSLSVADWFISQITSGHHKQLQALLSISYTPLPPPLFSLYASLSTVCHCHISGLFIAHAL